MPVFIGLQGYKVLIEDALYKRIQKLALCVVSEK